MATNFLLFQLVIHLHTYLQPAEIPDKNFSKKYGQRPLKFHSPPFGPGENPIPVVAIVRQKSFRRKSAN